MGLRDELLAQRERSAQRFGPDGMAVIDDAIEDLRRTGMAGTPTVGSVAPPFELPSARGGRIALGDLLGRRAVVLAFYRGGW
jgi:hypothetical protein